MKSPKDGLFSVSQVCAALHIEADVAKLLMAGPFAPDGDGYLALWQIIGCELLLRMHMLRSDDALRIALAGADGARQNGQHPRLLLVGWRFADREMFVGWISGETDIPADVQAPVLLVPVDEMAKTLAARLDGVRLYHKRPN